MDKNELRIIAQKYLEGTATPEEKQLLDQWYSTAYSGTDEMVELKKAETEADVKQRMFDNLNQQLFVKPEQQQSAKNPAALIKRMAIWIGSVAAVLALAFFGWSAYQNHTQVYLADRQVVLVPLNRVMHLTLPDSSKVWLNAGSVFRYPKKFSGKNRTVELVEGRAFFDIKHQKDHPFIVKAKNLNITVLGTSFDVRSYQKEGKTQVTVVSGKVGITLPNAINHKAIMLLPAEQIVLSNITNQMVKQITHEPKINEWCKSNFVFEQESLGNVFKALEKEYNTRITVADSKLLNEKISIKLNNQHLDTIMQILSFTKHFNYQMANDSTVIIK
ncbi:FecR family protein [Mucilaginibacter paludis]|uniref:Anti-FecI sigma factor, FecR n=1 Tax=Mucilaginibacter paludis DSM 18603 TaxID=714943 RepID=H1Y7Z2_9SPHI|nr:FecR family protein [Mucilaginibacter paludis]EHQ30478.1 anti-FecI sigma factor, FecR [Mucilaginibacter paludis DSM 18603]